MLCLCNTEAIELNRKINNLRDHVRMKFRNLERSYIFLRRS